MRGWYLVQTTHQRSVKALLWLQGLAQLQPLDPEGLVLSEHLLQHHLHHSALLQQHLRLSVLPALEVCSPLNQLLLGIQVLVLQADILCTLTAGGFNFGGIGGASTGSAAAATPAFGQAAASTPGFGSFGSFGSTAGGLLSAADSTELYMY